MTALFHLDNISLRYGNVAALTDCSLHVKAGEKLAVVGANGSGKSSLLSVLHGQLVPTKGIRQGPDQLRQAMLFQRPHMLRASVQNNVALGLWLRGVPWRQARRDALAALDWVGLADLAQRNARALSGGQQQRAALARAWCLKPQVMLLDEPTANLDPGAKREVEALMADFCAAGTTLIFSSHNLGQVKRLASRVIYMEHGRLIADLPVHEFFNGSLPAAAASFLKGELA
ncbi:Glutamine transport ATP-binding protein GlnQ [Polaromonas vacuolata]|uniref:Glutamine transport ATP-binding protein GlnQ n=1 Tax=Polaromonas vacuolata TaxID=37448 RepID=A0A6H2H7E8_9BURK|nr:ATP-binding cassette domain-containing protein [Polaromonas vacuolata]QJC55524.1 Glutamine transport ATP-binding protein GlnQ [Polaromonas vacuolata]